MEEHSDAVSEIDELAQSGDVHCTSVSKEKNHRASDNFLITFSKSDSFPRLPVVVVCGARR